MPRPKAPQLVGAAIGQVGKDREVDLVVQLDERDALAGAPHPSASGSCGPTHPRAPGTARRSGTASMASNHREDAAKAGDCWYSQLARITTSP